VPAGPGRISHSRHWPGTRTFFPWISAHATPNSIHTRHPTCSPRSAHTSQKYVRSPRPYRGISELEYPFHDWTAIVTTCGRCYEKRKVNLSTVFAGQKVGVSQVGEHIWLVSFMDYDLGYFDDETCRLEPIENPFWRKVLPMSPE
jgi:putative transposase